MADRLTQLATQVDDPSSRPRAHRFVVSVRTVENHLYRACAKLGTSNCAEMAVLLHSH
ncbi:MAG: hypothetical protein ACRDSH_15895 [Pseudonocardiaceae bacterium]